MKGILVQEFMQTEPTAAHPQLPLTDLVARLREGGYRALPVVDDEQRVVGTVSETDLFLKEHALPFSTEKVPSLVGRLISKEQIDQEGKHREMTVKQIMHPSAVTVDEETTLEDVALLMCERRLSMVPVIRRERLVGVVRRSDILAIIYGQAA